MAVTPGPPVVRRAAIRGTALLALLGLWASSATAASPWIELTSEDFVLVTNLSEKQARTLLRDFEVFQYGASRLLAGEDTRSGTPTYVVALDTRDFQAILPTENLVGAFAGRPFANYVLYDTGQRGTSGREVVFHEYVHFLLHNNAGFIYPAWYNEGLAELYSTITEFDGAIEFGRIPMGRAYTLVNAGWIPTAQLLKFDYRAPDFRSHRVIPQFYAQSWLMTHYFFIGNAERGRQLKQYLAEINQGSSTEDATRDAFGVDAEKLHGEFRRYWEAGRIPLRRVRFEEPLPTVAAAPLRPLPEAKAQAFLGYVCLHMQSDRRRATPFFQRALKSDPGEPLALAGMAVVKEAAGEVEEATALLVSAQSHPGVPMARLLAADLLFDRADYKPGEKDPGAQGLADARKAQELYESLLSDPEVGNHAKFGYARASMLLDEPEPEEVLAVVRPAAARLPTNTQLASVEATLFMRTGNFAAARVAAERAIRFAGSLDERKTMQSQLERIDKQLAKETSGGAGP